MVNSQNTHWLALSSQDVLILIKSKHPVHTMVFGVVTSNGNVMPSFIFPYGLRLNTEAYVNYLEKVVLPWIKRVFVGRPIYVATGLCTMPHKRENPILTGNFCNHITPISGCLTPQICDPLDYYVLHMVE